MARGKLIGLMKCPECDFQDAEIRPDKSGAPYRFCPDCTSQYFTRGVPHKVANLTKRMRPLVAPPESSGGAVTDAALVEAVSASAPVLPGNGGSGFSGGTPNRAPPGPAPKKKSIAFDLGAL